MSQSLLWEVTKKNNSYLRKQKNGHNILTFSSDPFNTTRFACAKDSGLCQAKAAGFVLSKSGRPTVTVYTKSTKANQPKNLIVKTGVSKGFTKSLKAVKKTALNVKYLVHREHDIMANYSAAARAQRKLNAVYAKAQKAKKAGAKKD